jgi:predicted nucleic acid-binding protein
MLSTDETAWLLYDLCIKAGFCLSSDAQKRLQEDPPSDVDGFTAAVFIEEELDPSTADKRLYRGVRTLVADAFHRSEEKKGDA